MSLRDLIQQRPDRKAGALCRYSITLANLSVLKTGKARAIRFTTLDALCQALDCQPGDLLEHVPDDDA